MLKSSIALIICIASFPIIALAQATNVGKPDVPPTAQTHSLRGKHNIVASIGLLHQVNASSDVGGSGLKSDSGVNGTVGGIAYTHWFRSDWALDVSIGIIGAEARSVVGHSGVSSETGTVIPMLFGVKYQPSAWALESGLRPFLSGAVGPYIGIATKTRAGIITNNETFSQSVLGFHGAAGLDWFFTRFSVGVRAGYHLLGDFDQPIGAQRNYSGPEFSLNFGILLGGGSGR